MDAMSAGAGVNLAELRVDGGMVANELLMQFHADQIGVDVIATWNEEKRGTSKIASLQRDQLYRNWKKAVTKIMGWVDEDVKT